MELTQKIYEYIHSPEIEEIIRSGKNFEKIFEKIQDLQFKQDLIEYFYVTKQVGLSTLEIIPAGFFSELTTLLAFGSKQSNLIPSNVTSIGGEAFSRTGLSSVSIPGSAKLHEAIFFGCPRLEEAIIRPGSTSRLPKEMFYGCKNLKKVVLPENIVAIEKDCFTGCSSDLRIYTPKRSIEKGNMLHIIPSEVELYKKALTSKMPQQK